MKFGVSVIVETIQLEGMIFAKAANQIFKDIGDGLAVVTTAPTSARGRHPEKRKAGSPPPHPSSPSSVSLYSQGAWHNPWEGIYTLQH